MRYCFGNVPLVALDHLGHVRFLEVPGLVVAQLELDRLDGLVDALLAAEPHDRVHARLLDGPRDSHERHPDASLLRDLLQPVDDVLVDLRLLAADEGLEEVVRLFAFGGSVAPRSGQDAAADGRPGDAAHAGSAAVGEHLALFFAVDEVVVVLHGDELMPGARFWLAAM